MRFKGRKAETGLIWMAGDLDRGWFQEPVQMFLDFISLTADGERQSNLLLIG